MRLLLSSLACGVLCVSCGLHADAKEEQAKDQFEKQLFLTLESKEKFVEISGSYRLKADLVALPAGQQGIVRLWIKNPEQFDLPVSEASASCGCTKAQLMKDIIPAGGMTELRIEMKTPAKHKGRDFVSNITLKLDKKRLKHDRLTQVRILISYEIEGLLSFKNEMQSVAVTNARRTKLKIPFVHTLKVPLSDLIVEAEGAFEGVVGEVAGTTSDPRIEIDVDGSFASEIGSVGRLKIRSPDDLVSSTTQVILYSEPPMSLSPRTLRFKETENGDFVSMAILRVREKSRNGEAKMEGEGKSTLHLDAMFGSDPVKCAIQPLGKHAFRLELRMSRKLYEANQGAEQPATAVRWVAVAKDSKFSGESSVTFSF